MDAQPLPDYLPAPVMPKYPLPQWLAGQTALVTGASSGIGREVAIALAAYGAAVVVNYASSEAAALEAIDEIKRRGGTAVPHKADVAVEADVTAMFSDIIAQFGTLDILVNNAGLQKDSRIEDMTLLQWERVIGVNLTGQFLCSREAIREFKRRGPRPEISSAAGKIICISSVHDVIPWAGHANYAASKGGVMMLMKSIAQEVAPFRIRVNSISPGAIRTPINTQAWDTAQAYADLLKLIPYKRIGEALEIGRAAAWLASDYADYITGQTIYVDGGMTLYPGFESGG